MTRSERRFVITTLYGIAIHVVTDGAPAWLAALYVAVMTALYLIALFAIRRSDP
jgi:hypothetical protein